MALRARHASLRLWASKILLPTRTYPILHDHPTFKVATQVRNIGSALPDLDQHASITLQFPKTNNDSEQSTPVQISKPELQQYIYPLLCHGWKLNTEPTKGLFLARKMVFKGPVSARNFLKELLCAEENNSHHTTTLYLDGEKRPNLTITTQTHDLAHPWLSLKDASLAASLENIYREKTYGPVKGKLAVQPPHPIDQATWTTLLLEYPWDAENIRIKDNKVITL